jgi:hypothetical protein
MPGNVSAYFRNTRKAFLTLIPMTALMAFLGLCFPGTAQAGYLDPGSGSTLVQWIIAFFAGLRRVKHKFLNLFSGKGKRG